MRWDNLFADLEGQLAAAGRLDLEAQVAELVRAEQAAVPLADRLRGHGTAALDVELRGRLRFRGTPRQIADEWFVLECGQHGVLVPASAVVTVSGLGRRVHAERSTVRRTLSMASGLRALARDRTVVTVFLDGGGGEPTALAGTIDTVGADYLELTPVRSAGGHRAGMTAVRLGAILAVRSGG
ncbi:hypothetical protein SCMU_26300 [Sinomonas cyclohexanicum]|uniref:Uncharacterized protein n=1 Tax=Sinomonas cyclohexanicum TaxID=322009 RepID=A0ABN6FJB0_SINCY|nr:hypothetical protein [Corynebacterium cyclohexanicum]BCT76788.1 hypothetical protein SCMU_26300 [Corynebacterium cyclohexanicum]